MASPYRLWWLLLLVAFGFLCLHKATPGSWVSGSVDLEVEANKYFHGPSRRLVSHYDNRFFRRIVSDEERQDCLQRMVRAYLMKFHDMGSETWIAHGTLLGWWWNGKTLPWDEDVDTQVSEKTLFVMAHHHNGSLHRMKASNGKELEYLLDVNPSFLDRVRGDGTNEIDARWIDTHTGLYIGITGLSEANKASKAGILSCKNNHEYQKEEIFPLRQSEYEGAPAMVPYSYISILADEYATNGLTATEYEHQKWNATARLWLKME